MFKVLALLFFTEVGLSHLLSCLSVNHLTLQRVQTQLEVLAFKM